MHFSFSNIRTDSVLQAATQKSQASQSPPNLHPYPTPPPEPPTQVIKAGSGRLGGGKSMGGWWDQDHSIPVFICFICLHRKKSLEWMISKVCSSLKHSVFCGYL